MQRAPHKGHDDIIIESGVYLGPSFESSMLISPRYENEYTKVCGDDLARVTAVSKIGTEYSEAVDICSGKKMFVA